MPRLSFLISLYLPICKMFKINKLDTKLLKEEWDFDLNYSDDPISDSPYWLNHQILFKPLLLFACVNTMYFFFFFLDAVLWGEIPRASENSSSILSVYTKPKLRLRVFLFIYFAKETSNSELSQEKHCISQMNNIYLDQMFCLTKFNISFFKEKK